MYLPPHRALPRIISIDVSSGKGTWHGDPRRARRSNFARSRSHRFIVVAVVAVVTGAVRFNCSLLRGDGGKWRGEKGDLEERIGFAARYSMTRFNEGCLSEIYFSSYLCLHKKLVIKVSSQIIFFDTPRTRLKRDSILITKTRLSPPPPLSGLMCFAIQKSTPSPP